MPHSLIEELRLGWMQKILNAEDTIPSSGG